MKLYFMSLDPRRLLVLRAVDRYGGVVGAGAALAFEDSISGVTAAARAGLRTFAMLGWLGEPALRAAGATDVIDDFDDARLWRAIDAA